MKDNVSYELMRKNGIVPFENEDGSIEYFQINKDHPLSKIMDPIIEAWGHAGCFDVPMGEVIKSLGGYRGFSVYETRNTLMVGQQMNAKQMEARGIFGFTKEEIFYIFQNLNRSKSTWNRHIKKLIKVRRMEVVYELQIVNGKVRTFSDFNKLKTIQAILKKNTGKAGSILSTRYRAI